jgi:hypothetical protein
MRKATDKTPEVPPEKNQAAAELGRRGGKKGGAARAANMTPEKRADAARLAAVARWSRTPPEERRRPRSPDGEPFVFELLPAEIAQITGAEIVGSGGLQSLLRRLHKQLETGNRVEFDNAGLGQLIRYTTGIGGGGFETRLRRAFARSLLDQFTPIFEAERRG